MTQCSECGIMLPITLAKPHESVIPHSYVVRIVTQHCDHCNRQHQTSQCYTKTRLRRINSSQYVTNLRFLNEPPQYNLPVEKLEETTHIPYCHFCYNTVDLSHLTTPPDATYVIVGGNIDDGIAPEVKSKPKSSSRPKEQKVATISDLEKMAGL